MKRITLLLTLILGIAFDLWGAEETYSKHLRGQDIMSVGVLEIDAQRYNLPNWTVVEPVVRVRLYLAEDRLIEHGNNEFFSVVYTINLVGIDDMPVSPVTDTLTVDYHYASPYQDLDINEYRYFKAASLTVSSVSANITEDVVLEMQLVYPRYNGTGTISAPSEVKRRYSPTTNELTVTWEYLDGADEYDLEWLFIDNPALSNSIAFDFTNATRITTSDNFYNIPLAYPTGNILCRVRGRGTYYSQGEYYPVFGSWSFTSSSGDGIPDADHICRYDFAGLEDDLTWQYTAVYAEEGKRKEAITFYDGSLRSRQEVTVLNTDSVAIVGETFYDHVGRQALHALPAPTQSRGIRYYGTGGTAIGQFNGYFPKSQYDYDATLVQNLKFPTNAGSAIYHSSGNPFTNNTHWPNANQTPWDSGYTYTHVRYLNDGTDRVHSQSTVGSTFKMGGRHETRYLYGNPSQSELDRLFGNEVGDASHYQKVIAIDPNGEVSVSYYDMKERLIASAIVPTYDTSLLAVDNTPSAHRLVNTVSFDEDSRQYVQNIVVGEPSEYDFSYHISPASPLCDTCHERTGCMDCRYLVMFGLWCPETLSYLFKDSLLVSAGTTLFHHITLVPGSYQLYKSIILVDDDTTETVFDKYRNRQRQCVHYDTAEVRPCYTPCEVYAMKQADIKVPDPTNPTYAQALEDCENPPQSFNTECEAKRAAMLADMSPGGQYFDNIRTCCPGDSLCNSETTDPNGFLNTICSWRFEEDTELERVKDSAQCAGFNDTLWNYMRAHWRPEYAEVMLNYHPEYHLYAALCDCGVAEMQHRYDSIFMNTYDYDSAVAHGFFNPLGMAKNMSTEIQNNPNVGYQPFNLPDSIDPFFDELFACCPTGIASLRDSIVEMLNGYLTWESHHLSIWWLLDNPEHIDGTTSTPDYLPIRDVVVAMQESILPQWAGYYDSLNNAKWMLFKSIYLYLKEKIRRTVLPRCLLDCSTGYVRESCYDPLVDSSQCCLYNQLEWGQYEQWVSCFDTSSLHVCELYLKTDSSCTTLSIASDSCNSRQGGFQVRFLCNPVFGLDTDNYHLSEDVALETAYESCCEDCEAYANTWMNELHDYLVSFCGDIFSEDSLIWYSIRNDLIATCLESCQKSLGSQNFSVTQRLDSNIVKELLTNYCDHFSNDYPPIVHPRLNDMYSDCGCENYHQYLNYYGLTFWSEPSDIVDGLEMEGIQAFESEVALWNRFCIKSRYLNMLNSLDDTTALYGLHFPEQFRCQPSLPDSVLCRIRAQQDAAAQDTISFYRALDSLVLAHRGAYTSHCMDNVSENLTVSTSSLEFLYTLYYYDQADNLVKTVPPEGVHPITDDYLLNAVTEYRNFTARYDTLQVGFVRPNHTMVSNYRYNSLNQVIQSYQPDYDSVSYVYYDILSRPILSQDGKQRQHYKYSYTIYDRLGRIEEVGQVKNSTSFSRKDAAESGFINSFLSNGVKSEITKTWYDEPMSASLNPSQTHLRNRISAISFALFDDNTYQSATHYSYDIHGNVKRLVQDIPALSPFGRQFTTLDYEYDLISGNVNRVCFQRDRLEQFAHRYRYDADNRITHVYTSNIFKVKRGSAILQERLEARYFYLPTGALARTELGHKQIQGIDYAYTLQGWLKDVNGFRTSYYDFLVQEHYDMGADGHSVSNNLNSYFAKDAFSTSIQYFPGDYRPVSGPDYFNAPSNSAVPLYNGNISALTTGFYHIDETLQKRYRYDKLNRIKRMNTASRFFWDSGWGSVSDNYSTSYTFDWNGNLLSLRRKNESGLLMHDITYRYLDPARNRLDSITATGILSSRYQYDALGNLVRDNAENLTVTWNSLGKVDSIVKNSVTISGFRYSPTGQRQMKASDSDTTFYIHDATGNVMCVYLLQRDTLRATERHLYGSNRLGMLGHQVWVTATKSGFYNTNTIGTRTYELTDHLGNVTTTLSDRKYLYYDDNDGLTYSKPLVNSYTDYYPFGYPISDRSSDFGGYRYFFNGQEADNEVLGEGVSLTAEFWQYDTRLGRRWNVDPVFKEYESPYACFAGNPVRFADRFGADTIFDDETARKNFLDTYNEIVERISTIEKKEAEIRTCAVQRDWNEKKLNREIDKLHAKSDYNILLEMRQGFQEIMSDRSFCVTYSTDVSFLKKSQGGRTHYVDDKNVNVYYRPNMRGSLTHETRHAWGVMRKEWSNIGGYDTFDEFWAFTWQGVIDAPAVDKLIENAIQKYNKGKSYWERKELNLKEAIDYLYTTGDLKHDSKITVSSEPIPAP